MHLRIEPTVHKGGAKGVVGINPLLTGRKIILHESMIKFLSSDTGLHIANKFDHPLALYLNRYAILIAVSWPSKKCPVGHSSQYWSIWE
jgi:RNA dependent RNA polymerase